VTDLVLDPDRSRVRIHTFAEGLFARLAHDLELTCTGLEGKASRDGDRATARIEAPVSAIAVAGVLKGDRVEEHGLSTGEKHDVLDKMKKEVFHSSGDAKVVIEAALDGGSARVKLTPPNGRIYETTVKATVTGERATGSFEIPLSRIGSDTVKGPMGAFRMKDKVLVLFDVAFRAP
jgi:hypothetical protein